MKQYFRLLSLTVLGFLLISVKSFGQNNRETEFNNIGWYAFFGNFKFDDKWSIHGEFQWNDERCIHLGRAANFLNCYAP